MTGARNSARISELAKRRCAMSPREPLRTVRISHEIWQAAQERAESEGTTVSAVIRAALQVYVKGGKTK